MTNSDFRNLIVGILQHLEPFNMKKGQILFYELDDVSKIIFILNGSMGVGYELNKIKKIIV